jgi:hypothetical protein
MDVGDFILHPIKTQSAAAVYKHKHYLLNKEKYKESHKKYREKNVEKIRTLISCECGGIFNEYSKEKHQQTKRHLKKFPINAVLAKVVYPPMLWNQEDVSKQEISKEEVKEPLVNEIVHRESSKGKYKSVPFPKEMKWN